MANLGLLMDPHSRLNILPDEHRKEFSYYRSNQILQNSVLALLMTFSLSAFFQRTSIKPLKDQLPIKQSELSLLSMRQDMKNVVESRNKVANTFGQLINDDKNISDDMVSLLKHLSKTLPVNFLVTNVTLDIQASTSISTPDITEFYDLLITVDGFYDNDIEKASLYAEKLRKSFIAQGHFKNVEISKGKVLKRSRTGFKITILL